MTQVLHTTQCQSTGTKMKGLAWNWIVRLKRIYDNKLTSLEVTWSSFLNTMAKYSNIMRICCSDSENTSIESRRRRRQSDTLTKEFCIKTVLTINWTKHVLQKWPLGKTHRQWNSRDRLTTHSTQIHNFVLLLSKLTTRLTGYNS